MDYSRAFSSQMSAYLAIMGGVTTLFIGMIVLLGQPFAIASDAKMDQYSGAQVNMVAQLRGCLPKSDMASKSKCDLLLSYIDTYDDCVHAGFPVTNSSPRQCKTIDGRSFINSESSK